MNQKTEKEEVKVKPAAESFQDLITANKQLEHKSEFLAFCKRELELAGAFDEKRDFYGGMTGKAVMQLCELFDIQRHSGMSATVVSSIFHRLTKWIPLTPLTGEDWEWNDISDKMGTRVSKKIYQNKRASNVYKEGGVAYQVDYYVFKDKEGATYTSRASRKEIEFPYMPTHVHRSPEAKNESA